MAYDGSHARVDDVLRVVHGEARRSDLELAALVSCNHTTRMVDWWCTGSAVHTEGKVHGEGSALLCVALLVSGGAGRVGALGRVGPQVVVTDVGGGRRRLLYHTWCNRQ